MEQRQAAGLRRGWRLLALLSAVAAAAYFLQGPSENANAHYALVRALAEGTPVVDRTRHEVGDLSTVDVSLFKGHYYSQKAPGLAIVSVPAYLGLRASGADLTGDPTRALWVLGLFALVLPGLGIALLVERLGETVAQGAGTAAAVTILLGTLLLPFSGLFHAHVLSGALGLLAFALLWRERAGPQRLRLVAAGGAAAGFAIATEYTLALVAAVMFVYALSRPGKVRRALAYAGGLLAGVSPLLLYNWWAFRNPFHLTYTGAVDVGGQGVVEDAPATYIDLPDVSNLTTVLFARWGLVTSTPVLVAGAAALALLYRRGRRAEALAVGATVVAFLLFIASFSDPFGATFAPRYLVPMLPFLGVPIALAYRAVPLATFALAVVSVTAMSVVTASRPLAAWDGRVLERLFSPVGHGQTVFDLVGITGWVRVLPFFALVACAVAVATLPVLRAVRSWRAELGAAGIAVAGWAVLAAAAPTLLEGAAEIKGVLAAAFTLAVTGAAVAVRQRAIGAQRTFGRPDSSSSRS